VIESEIGRGTRLAVTISPGESEDSRK